METFLIKALQLVLSLSILVFIHELGHFIFARIFKVRVEKFYIFFDPWFSLFKYKPKNSDTEYGIGWLPLGGYCKIAGMIDESMDKEQMAQPPQPYEFRSKPAGQRLMIMVAGVLFNFLLALFIYSMILFKWGDTYLPLDQVSRGMDFSETFHNIGFQDGDILLSADGEKLLKMDENTLRKTVNANTVMVLRNGVETSISIPEDMMQRLLRDKQGFAIYRIPVIVKGLPDNNTPAARAGLLPNDTIIRLNGIFTPTVTELREQLDMNKGKEVEVTVNRAGSEQVYTMKTDTAGNIGILMFHPLEADKIYGTVHTSFSFFESFPAGIKFGLATLKGYMSDMKLIFTKEGASSLGGFGTIGSMFPAQWDWFTFWMRTAFLSIALAFVNILPIPALDGGHVMFLLYEVIARRKPSDKFMEYAQITGMFILLGLLLFANGNDIMRFFFNS